MKTKLGNFFSVTEIRETKYIAETNDANDALFCNAAHKVV